jgi:molybdopterin-guanine dinucleotide biosynthesis adapter protein
MRIFGIIGWKNSGKTGLLERLVEHITDRGFSVSTMKHAHHSFDIDHKGKDSYRHRKAGAHQVLLSSDSRWVLMTEFEKTTELEMDVLLSKMNPVDLILVEGFKANDHLKIETYRAVTKQNPLAKLDKQIKAIATKDKVDLSIPIFDLDDTKSIADFILKTVRLL